MVFIGHGSDPDDASQMPPSNDKNAGRLVFLNQVVSGGLGQKEVTGVTKKYDDLSDFWLKAKKTLFICQACYSGNVIEKATKSKCYDYFVISMCNLIWICCTNKSHRT